MDDNALLISNKYAHAFLHIFFDQLTPDDIMALEQISQFLEQDRRIIFFLRLPIIENNIKLQGLQMLVQQWHLPQSIMVLIKLLSDHKRLDLLPMVLSAIVRFYREEAGIMSFVITSAPSLTSQEVQTLIEFLARVTGRSIIYEYKVDTRLIAGIRLQSTTLFWEQSIAKRLGTLARLAWQ
jgi:ATP synthase F1 delta subunit